MAISDRKQRIMPSGKDRNLGQVLAYKEAVLLTNTTDPILKGEVRKINFHLFLSFSSLLQDFFKLGFNR